MQAQLKTQGEISIVFITGALDIEKTQPFRQVCEKHLTGKKVIFNLDAANFVGSTGIQSFIEALRIVGESTSYGTRLVGLKPEFKRIFANLQIQGLEIHETEKEAIVSFTTPRTVVLEVPALPLDLAMNSTLDPEVGE